MPFLKSFALSLCKDVELAKDLAQETLCRAWRARMSFRPDTNFKAWLCAIFRNLLYTHHRRAWRQVPYDEAAALNIPGPEAPQDWAAMASDAVRALNALPPKQREAVVLIGLGGLGYAEAAGICGCPEGTVKSRVTRARKAASDALEGHVKLSGPRPPISTAVSELIRELDDAMA
jgi:RNA polymerase sigma-70 factor (ECF subfamily)